MGVTWENITDIIHGLQIRIDNSEELFTDENEYIDLKDRIDTLVYDYHTVVPFSDTDKVNILKAVTEMNKQVDRACAKKASTSSHASTSTMYSIRFKNEIIVAGDTNDELLKIGDKLSSMNISGRVFSGVYETKNGHNVTVNGFAIPESSGPSIKNAGLSDRDLSNKGLNLTEQQGMEYKEKPLRSKRRREIEESSVSYSGLIKLAKKKKDELDRQIKEYEEKIRAAEIEKKKIDDQRDIELEAIKISNEDQYKNNPDYTSRVKKIEDEEKKRKEKIERDRKRELKAKVLKILEEEREKERKLEEDAEKKKQDEYNKKKLRDNIERMKRDVEKRRLRAQQEQERKLKQELLRAGKEEEERKKQLKRDHKKKLEKEQKNILENPPNTKSIFGLLKNVSPQYYYKFRGTDQYEDKGFRFIAKCAGPKVYWKRQFEFYVLLNKKESKFTKDVKNYAKQIGISNLYMKESSLDEIAEKLKDDSIDLLICPISLSISSSSAHANVLIINKKTKKAFRFEPHGKITQGYNVEKVDYGFRKFVQFNLPGFTYLAPKEYQQMIGVQPYERTDTSWSMKVSSNGRRMEAGGFCSAWVMIYTWEYAMNYETRDERFIESSFLMQTPKYLADSIRKFMSLLAVS